MPVPFTGTVGNDFSGHNDFHGFELRRFTMWNLSDTLTGSYGATPPDGSMGWQTVAAGSPSKKHMVFYDTATGADVIIPRTDCGETWSAVQAFSAYFTVPGTTKITNLNADLLDGYNTSLTAVQGTIPVYDTSGTLYVATPTAGGHAANKDYVDSVGQGLFIKDPCDAATTAAIANLASCPVLQDGYTLVAGQRVLVKDTASPDGIAAVSAVYNGIYVVGTVVAGNAPLTRATDADTSAEVDAGMYTYINNGTVNRGSSWVQTTNNPTINVSSLVFSKFYQAVAQNAGNGIDITGNVIAVKIEGSTTYVANRILFNGSTTTIDSDANLTWNGTGLGIGGDAGSYELSLQAASGNMLVKSTTGTNNAYALYQNTGNDVYIGADSSVGDFMSGGSAYGLVILSNTAGRDINFGTAGTMRWRITSAGILQSNGAQTIQTSTGQLDIKTAAGNGNIVFDPHGTGITLATGGLAVVASDQLWLDGGGDTYWQEVAANTARLVCGGTEIARFTATSASLSYLTQKSVLFAGASGAVSQNAVANTFQWDDSLVALGVGGVAQSGVAITAWRTGAKTASEYGLIADVGSTSSTASIRRYGLFVQNTGTWNGAGAEAVGIWINAVSGGTTNWALYNNTAANVYLGTGNALVGATSSTVASRLQVVSSSNSVLNVETTGTDRADITLTKTSGTAQTWALSVAGSTNGYGVADRSFHLTDTTSGAVRLTVNTSGRLGLGGAFNPSFDISFGGNTSRTMALERHTVGGNAGNAFTITAGGCASGGSNLAGGTLFLRAGQNTGSGGSTIEFYTCAAGGAATTDGIQTLRGSINTAGQWNITGLTASMLVQTDASKNLISSNNLPSGTTLNSITIARHQTALITGVSAGGTVTITMAAAFATTAYHVQIIKVSTGETWGAKVARSSTTQFVITFGYQAADNDFRWIAIGD